MATIITPRPPLNLFEAVRLVVNENWTTLYNVPDYTIPASGPNPSRIVKAAAIMTGITFTPILPSGANVSIRVLNVSNTPFPVLNNTFVPGDDFLSVSLDRQVLLSGETIQVRCEAAGQQASVGFSFILNQREEFTEVAI